MFLKFQTGTFSQMESVPGIRIQDILVSGESFHNLRQ